MTETTPNDHPNSDTIERSKLRSISAKLFIAMLTLSILTIVAGASSYLVYDRILSETTSISRKELPDAVLSAQMRKKMAELNNSVVLYVQGDVNQRNVFEENHAELTELFRGFENREVTSAVLPLEMRTLIARYRELAFSRIFDVFNPEAELWAKQRSNALTGVTGRRLEVLLDRLKESEIADAGEKPEFNEVINDDLPGVRYYLELVDEAGDMTGDISQYVNGDSSAKESFISNSQSFEEFMNALRPLETREQEIRDLDEAQGYYVTLRDGGYEIISRYDPSTKRKAILGLTELRETTGNRLEELLDGIVDQSDTVRQGALGDLEKLSVQSDILLLSLLTGIIATSVGITIFAFRSISQPISMLGRIMVRLAQGQTTIEIPYDARRDEIGSMSRSIQQFRENAIARLKVEEELRGAKNNAEAATEAKANFLAAMSHEIRTPLNGILGMVELLNRTVLDEKQQHMTATIKKSGDSLLTIINDILDLSKIEAGKMSLSVSPTEIVSVVEEAATALSTVAEEKNLSIICNVSPVLLGKYNADSARIRQILINLLGNAIKFSNTGQVVIGARPIQEAGQSTELEFFVKDEGIGIPEAQQNLLFQNFSQLDAGPARQHGGTGLGLAICKRLIEIMNGQIGVQSVVGQGSTFWFRVELEKVEGSNIVDRQNALSGISIALSFENDYLTQVLSNYLTFWSANAFALDKETDTFNANILICDDTNQPRIEDAQRAGIKTIVIERRDTENTYPYPSSDFTRLYGNPVRRSELLSEVARLLDRESPETYNHQNFEFPMHAELPTREKAIAQGRLVLVVEDNEVNRELMERQLSMIGYRCDLAENGNVGLSKWQENSYGLILCDCHMPGMDGFELCGMIRKIESERKLDRTPIVAVTANVMQGEKERCIEAGMDDYLAKPFTLDSLVQLMDDLIADGKCAPEFQLEIKNSLFDQAMLTDSFGDDKEFHIHIIGRFLDAASQSLEDIARSSIGNDYPAIVDHAHKIKSTARGTGANEFAQLMENIEEAAKEGSKAEILSNYEACKEQLAGLIDEHKAMQRDIGS